MNITIFTTGGTIDKVYFDAKGGYAVGKSMVDQILKDARIQFPVDVVELMRKDSLEMTPEDRSRVVSAVAAATASHVVITHGTDTMIETGLALQAVAGRTIIGKTIVLTGALQPGRFADSDAAFNLGMAVAAAQTLPPGVYVAASGRIFAADRVRKDPEANRFVAL
ncbi:MAG TPA: asparaginase domain-containing protein [Steroidobacteraceae bacterium]|jgi:L-asparaginase|nr:asparaginase domain-containing protein [Steroidobacteraceae bacterium]